MEISLKEIFNKTINTYERNLKKIGVILILIILYDVIWLGIKQLLFNKITNTQELFLNLTSFLIESGLQLFLLILLVNLILNKNRQFKVSVFLRYVWATILVSAGFFLGMLLLIIPGIFWLLKSYFTDVALIESDLGAKDAIKRSFKITSNNLSTVIKYVVIIILLYIPVYILYLIQNFTPMINLNFFQYGLISSLFETLLLPISIISSIYIYEKLRNREISN